MVIGIASDHRGYELKKKILEKYNNMIDYGTDSTESTDYPKYAFKIGEDIRDKKIDLGILICGSGIGMSIACNKVKGVRCAKVNNELEVKYTRNDNDANVISFSADVGLEVALKMIDTFTNTPFSDEEKHKRRVNLISNYEDKNA